MTQGLTKPMTAVAYESRKTRHATLVTQSLVNWKLLQFFTSNMMMLYDLRNKLPFQIIYLISSIIEILLLSGITYGWASIALVFKEEGFFKYLCPYQTRRSNYSIDANTTIATVTATQGVPGRYEGVTCSLQSKRLNLIFNVAVAFLCCFKFPIGIFADKYGPRASQILGCSLYVIGGLGLAFVNKETADILFPIFIFICVGGGFIAVSKYQVSRIIYTRARSLVLSILHGTFDSSAIVLVFFKLAFEGGISLRDISLFYTILCCVLVALSTSFLTPAHQALLTEAERIEPSGKRRTRSEEVLIAEESISSAVVPETLLKSIASPLYLLELMFLCFCQLRLWYFIGSLDELVNLHFPNDKKSVSSYITYFGYAQVSGIIVGPFVGLLFDRNSIKCGRNDTIVDSSSPIVKQSAELRIRRIEESVVPFFLTNLFCLVVSVLSLSPWKWGLIVSFVFHVTARGFLYSSHASYIALAFRPERFATLYGLGIFIAGIFGLLEYPLYAITHKHFGADPFWVNFILLLVVIASNIFPLYLKFRCKKIKCSLCSSSVNFAHDNNAIIVSV